MNGRLVEFEKATVHVMSHGLHYGSGVFEGIRCYNTRRGPAVFRLADHLERMVDSSKVYRMELPLGVEAMSEVVLETIRANGFDNCYIRPIAFRGFGPMGVNPLRNPVDLAVAVWPWGKYLGEEALEQGVDVCVSSWTRIAPNTLPSMAKAGANYMNSQLIKMEAKINGYAEGIALDPEGYISEGSGENVFLIKKGVVMRPPLYSTVLPGSTRDSIIKICEEMGIPVLERAIPREMLYIADEVFFTGTAAEITPIRSVDKIKIGAGKRGPLTTEIQKQFFDITSGA